VGLPIKLSSRPTREFWELAVLFEEDQLLALDKPAGLQAAPDPANPERPSLVGLLEHGLAAAAPWATSRDLTFLALTHPLDGGASGVVLLAKSPAAQAELARQFAAEVARQRCVALVQGTSSADTFTVEARLAADPVRPERVRVVPHHGRRTVTQFTVIERFRDHTLLRCEPRTQHEQQIRVHLHSQRLPLAGDQLYGGRPLWLSRLKPGYRFKADREELPLLQRVTLHAEELECRQPGSGEPLVVRSPWPKDLNVALKYLRRYAPAPAAAVP
jgi:RluA family pseudouridine synthase